MLVAERSPTLRSGLDICVLLSESTTSGQMPDSMAAILHRVPSVKLPGISSSLAAEPTSTHPRTAGSRSGRGHRKPLTLLERVLRTSDRLCLRDVETRYEEYDSAASLPKFKLKVFRSAVLIGENARGISKVLLLDGDRVVLETTSGTVLVYTCE